jgi:hypothetical protein
MRTRQAIALLTAEEEKLRLLAQRLYELKRSLTGQMHNAPPHRLAIRAQPTTGPTSRT